MPPLGNIRIDFHHLKDLLSDIAVWPSWDEWRGVIASVDVGVTSGTSYNDAMINSGGKQLQAACCSVKCCFVERVEQRMRAGVNNFVLRDSRPLDFDMANFVQ